MGREQDEEKAMGKKIGFAAGVLLGGLALAACDADSAAPQLARQEEALFDCHQPEQRFSCPAPADASKRFVCHATGAADNPYVKLSVPWTSAHAPGIADGGGAADQSPGASAIDVGEGDGLDCDCNPRVCASVCTGGTDGAACDDGDRCTTDGACEGGECSAGAARCEAGVEVDACNVQSGACDGDTGACGLTPRPAGTVCGDQLVCDGAGSCVGVPHVTINEIESSGGVPGDWVELTNTGTAAADVSGWRVLDGDDSHTAYALPAGSTIAVGGYLLVEEAAFGFGLGGADTVRLYDAGGALVDRHDWATHAPSTYGRCPDGTGGFRSTTRITKGAANDCSIAVVINEIESSGGTPGDWVELYNPSPIAFDLSGFIFKDNVDADVYRIPSGTTLAAGGFYLLEESQFGFGLGGNDAARLYDAAGAPIDAHAWTAHATGTTYGRCPDGTGAFTTTGTVTKGAVNDCGGPPPPPALPAWPGANAVTTVDGENALGMNVSDLFYEAGAAAGGGDVIWAVRNAPSQLYRLVWNGAIWTPETGTGWELGKLLRYPSGLGDPDAEGVTRAEPGSTAIYVATERDNLVSGVSRLAILRFDPTVPGATLSATHEWNLTADLPAVGPNVGLEAITWIPDDVLTATGFFDEAKGHAYAPGEYADHGSGLFFVGMESSGIIYAYALDHATGGFTRIATIASGNPAVMSVWYDRDVGYLWAHCDDTCGNVDGILTVDTAAASPTRGRFVVRKQYARPTTLANGNNEGITIAPASQCIAGQRRFYWTDDSATGGHTLRADSVPCGAFVP
jgi:hypothetical protein